MSDYGAVPANTAEGTRELQDRLGRFARSLGVISGVMLVASVTNAFLSSADEAPISISSRVVHVAATLDEVAKQTAHDAPAAKLWWEMRAPQVRARRGARESASPHGSMTIDLIARALREHCASLESGTGNPFGVADRPVATALMATRE